MNSGHFYRYHQAYYFGHQRFFTGTVRFCLSVFSICPSDKNESVLYFIYDSDLFSNGCILNLSYTSST
jgi:hypothetical protein